MMTNADKFKGIFGLYATELWAKSEEELLAWLNADVPNSDDGDTISRQAAIDVMLMAIDDDWEPDYATDRMNELPSAQGYNDAINRLQEIANDYKDAGNKDAYYVADYCLSHLSEI